MSIVILASAALCIASVHDGDTLRLCSGERIRLLDIDAPELAGSPRCDPRHPRPHAWCGADALARRSRDALAAFVASGPATIERKAKDRYGRTLAHITVNGRDAGKHLIGLGLARKYR